METHRNRELGDVSAQKQYFLAPADFLPARVPVCPSTGHPAFSFRCSFPSAPCHGLFTQPGSGLTVRLRGAARAVPLATADLTGDRWALLASDASRSESFAGITGRRWRWHEGRRRRIHGCAALRQSAPAH